MRKPNPKLNKLYEQIAKHTFSDCKKICPNLGNCCEKIYCDIAKQWAQKRYDIKLQPTSNQNIPFLGPNGCVVSPFLRPLCALHHCSINSFGVHPEDQKWTKKYYKLRETIELMEGEVEELCPVKLVDNKDQTKQK